MGEAMKITSTAELRKALLELGAEDLTGPWGERRLAELLEKATAGKPFAVLVGSERLGRCYNRYTEILVGGTEDSVSKGNGGNYRVLARGEHPLLGAWIKTSHEVDSSD